MPRTKIGIPAGQLEIEDELRERFGGMMTPTDVGREMGLSDAHTYYAWLRDVPYTLVNNRRRYRVRDVAKKLYANRFVDAEGEAL